MTYMPIQLPPGIVRGANPDDAPGRWYDGSLIRWREGIMEPVGGWVVEDANGNRYDAEGNLVQ